MHKAIFVLTSAVLVAQPSVAYAADGDVPSVLAVGTGVAGLIASAVLLAAMFSLARIAAGAAIAENIKYAVLAVICLSASVLMSWIALWVPAFSAEHARLGADLLTLVALVFFAVYFYRVKLAMSRFLKRLTGEEQMIAAVIDPDVQVGE